MNKSLFVFAWAVTGVMSRPRQLEMIDMSYKFDNNTIKFPDAPKFKLKVLDNGTVDDTYWYQNDAYSSGTHVGTHIDAPCHFARGHPCIDEVPLSQLVGPVAVIDISQRARSDRDALVAVQDLVDWENLHREKLNGKIVLVYSGWGQYWGDKEKYTGTSTDDATKLHFPGVSVEAAQWLVDKRKILGLGIDTLSLDNGPSQSFMAHRILLGDDLFGLENVANIDKIPRHGATLYVMPMKIANSSGAPVRLMASFSKRSHQPRGFRA